jgi:hypothetical protein
MDAGGLIHIDAINHYNHDHQVEFSVCLALICYLRDNNKHRIKLQWNLNLADTDINQCIIAHLFCR